MGKSNEAVRNALASSSVRTHHLELGPTVPITVRCLDAGCGHVWQVDEPPDGKAFCPRCHRETLTGLGTEQVQLKRKPRPAKGEAPGTIGPFEIRGELGSGSFGVVYRAYDPRLEREIALKVPHSGSLVEERHITRFLTEAKAAAKLLHPNVVPVYETGRDGERYYIASAFIVGRPLADLIEPGGMAPLRAARLILQLCAALAHAHERGIIHRDVKPSNILVDPRDHAFLADFGLAGSLRQEGSRLTTAGTVMGTPAFMAPEQARGDIDTIGPAADQYSAGVTLYQLLTGKLPFYGPAHAVIYQINFEPPPTLRSHRPDLDSRLEAICLKAMAKKPGERFASCAQFAAALREWATPQPPKQPTTVVKSKKSRKRDEAPLLLSVAPQQTTKKADVSSSGGRAKLLLGFGLALVAGGVALGLALNRRNAGSPTTPTEVVSNEKGSSDQKSKVDADKKEAAIKQKEAKAKPLADPPDIRQDFDEVLRLLVSGRGSTNFVKQVGEQRMLRWREAADAGSAKGAYLFAKCLELGVGLAKDPVGASDYCRRAAEANLAAAQNNLGYYYDKGIGVKVDKAVAVSWYRKAADQDYPPAQYYLAESFLLGDGVTKDEKQAARLYHLAADKAFPLAQSALGCCYLDGVGERKDPLQAVSWFRKAANQDDPEGQYRLGRCYENGEGVTKDAREAVRWYRQAAEQGHPDAQNNLGVCFATGDGIAPDPKAAADWFRKAADSGHAGAQFNLAGCYEMGEGVTKSAADAVKWYRAAADQGHAEAQAALKRLGGK